MTNLITTSDMKSMRIETTHGTFTPMYTYKLYDYVTDTYQDFKLIKTGEEVYSEWLDNNFDLVNGEYVPKQIDICLDDLKLEKIKDSKLQLENWLQKHPLFSKVHNPNGDYYTVTDEKQSFIG